MRRPSLDPTREAANVWKPCRLEYLERLHRSQAGMAMRHDLLMSVEQLVQAFGELPQWNERRAIDAADLGRFGERPSKTQSC